ncbi:MAG: class II poly(R)-hydroxyalkanoic acid synthase [Robiginitomaculum sp.]|nr:MAG: class II poly(R)-hydroxyalkanoic acid synthase [Robiginitomaculum sp.]
MAKETGNIGSNAASNTTALNPMMGINRQELLGAVAMLLRRTGTSPKATAKYAGRMAKESVEIALGKSERAPEARDRRFQDPAWTFNPFYKRGLQAYLAMQDNLHTWVEDLKLDELEHARAQFVMGMIVDALAPTNSLAGNPMAQKRVIDSGGLSLIKGLKNVYDDMTKNGGMPSQVDKRPFKVGENLANTPGKVVWKNDLMELIQYIPTTEKVHKIPFLQIPPQINKFYASDLSPKKSVVRFLLSQGFQTFIVSWANPQKENAHWGLQDYVDSLIQASEVIAKITGSKKLNVSGACSGGITTATFASTLAAAGDKRINALTFQVCVLDPRRDDSELGQIVSEKSIEIARSWSRNKGILKGDDLARMFAWMRPNDLVWSYVINNYLMGQDPPPFDVLFWNADTTNLPAQLHSDYLDMSVYEPFANPGEVEFAGHVADLTKVKCDTFIVAGIRDHITPWKACYRTTKLLGSKNIKFVLSNSGHIQSLLNPPGNPKSKYFSNPELAVTADEWAANAEEKAGSWWVEWAEWLKDHSGPMKIAPRKMGSEAFPPLVDAPGEYVFG